MKTTLTFALVAFAALLQAQQVNLKLVSDTWPPFTGDQPGSAVASDLVREALNRIEVASGTTIMDFSEAMRGIESGTYDGSAALWKTPEREEFLIFSRPYLENRLILVGRKGSDVGALSVADLAGKKVALVEGYAYGDEISGASNVEFVNGKNDQHNLERLLSGEVDYMLVDDLLIHYIAENQPEEVAKYLEVGLIPMGNRFLHFAIRRDYPAAEIIVGEFNKAIAEMIADGTYHSILNLDWIRADIDGDGVAELILGGKQAGVAEPTSGYDMTGVQDSADSTAKGESYYIDGQLYNDWQTVPSQYKVNPTASGVGANSNRSGFGMAWKF